MAMPPAIASSIAGFPSFVPGIFDLVDAAIVCLVSF